MPGWMNHKLESKLPEEILTISDMLKCRQYRSNGRKWRRSKEYLDECERKESEKVGLNINIQKTKIMASGYITSLQIDGGTMEMMTDFIFLGSKSLRMATSVRKIKRCLLPGKKAVTNLGSVLKIKEITLLTKVCIVKVILFPVVLYRCESLTIKKTEHKIIDAFTL